MIKLCPTEDIAVGAAKEFFASKEHRLFVVNHSGQFFCYRNRCPHADLPLNLAPNVFLDLDKRYIQCANHMATFNIKDGLCIAGPCPGASLESINIVEENGALWIRPTLE